MNLLCGMAVAVPPLPQAGDGRSASRRAWFTSSG